MTSITEHRTVFDAFPPFAARAPWWGADLQTLRNTLLNPRPRLASVRGRTLSFPMDDGTRDVLLGVFHRPPMPKPGLPLVVLVHGLTGDIDSCYMHETAHVLLGHGFPVLRLNQRGAGVTRRYSRHVYHAGRTEDFRKVVAQLPGALTGSGVVPVGFSLGGNMVLKFLGEGAAPVIRAGASISAPIDLRRTSLRMMQARNFAYHRWLLARMKEEAFAGPLEPHEEDRVRGAKSCWEFDDRLIAPRNGWSGAEEYYAVNSAARFLDAIAVPTLVIHALDDPWIPGSIYAERDWNRNPRLVPLLPRRGGHVGFHGPGTATWHDQCLVRFLERVTSEG